MDTAVKWIYQQQRVRKGSSIMIDAGQKPALCFRGHKYMLCVAAGYPVRVLKRPVADFTRCRDVMHGADGKNYPVMQAAQRLVEIGQRNTITEGARRLLERALQGGGEDIDEEAFQDEEELTMLSNENPAPTDGADDSDDINAATSGEEKTMTTTKPKGKGKGATTTKPKAKGKAPAKAKANGAAKPKGETPFRPGTAKEKAFLLYKAYRKDYEELAKGEKGAWCEKQAEKLGIAAGTMKSWIGGPFSKALA